MLGLRKLMPMLVVAALAALGLTSGTSAAPASTGCGIVSASGHAWIVVAKSVTCPEAKSVTRAFAPRTAALHSGQRRLVTTTLLPGFHCVLASQGKPGGSCSTAGAAKSVLWIVAA